MKVRKSQAIVYRFKSAFADNCRQARGRIAILSTLALVCLVAGIIVFSSNSQFFPGNENILDFGGVKLGFGAFFARSFSITVVMGILYVFSLSVWTFPLGGIVIGFRSYLLGFNICALCSYFGLSGLLEAVFIVLPCQILTLFLFVTYFAIMSKSAKHCKGYGEKGKGKNALYFFLGMIVLNLIETLLLLIFSSKVILVI